MRGARSVGAIVLRSTSLIDLAVIELNYLGKPSSTAYSAPQEASVSWEPAELSGKIGASVLQAASKRRAARPHYRRARTSLQQGRSARNAIEASHRCQVNSCAERRHKKQEPPPEPPSGLLALSPTLPAHTAHGRRVLVRVKRRRLRRRYMAKRRRVRRREVAVALALPPPRPPPRHHVPVTLLP